VLEGTEGGNFVPPFGQGLGPGLRNSGDVGHDPEGGVNETRVSCQKRRGRGRENRGKERKLARMFDTQL
jgi:hypothetical protein